MEKPWYLSKLTWLGVITTLIGVLELIAQWLQAGAFQAQDFVLLAVGILTVILRVWFTDTKLIK